MHRRRIGMSHSFLPLILSSLLIATSALPDLPGPAGIDINIPLPNMDLPPIPKPQDGAPDINIPLPNINLPPIPKPEDGAPDINIQFPNINLPPIPKPEGGGLDINIALPKIDLPPLPNINVILPQPQEPSAPNIDGEALAKEFLDLHNYARRHARLPPFVWDVKLEEYARDYANQRVNSGDCHTLVHSMGPYGENLFWGRGSNWKPKDAVKKWIKEHRFYNMDANTCKVGKVCGHYTQVVWRDSIRLGCAVATCPNNDTLVVCSYDPPGNYLGELPYFHYNH